MNSKTIEKTIYKIGVYSLIVYNQVFIFFILVFQYGNTLQIVKFAFYDIN